MFWSTWTWTWTWTWSTHLAHVLVPSKLSAAVDHQPDKLGECELERSSFLGRVVEPLPHPGKRNSTFKLKSEQGDLPFEQMHSQIESHLAMYLSCPCRYSSQTAASSETPFPPAHKISPPFPLHNAVHIGFYQLPPAQRILPVVLGTSLFS